MTAPGNAPNRLLRVHQGGIDVPRDTARYVIETDSLFLRYGRKTALDHLSLRIPPGRIHAIVGANGAGKSSLFRVLLGAHAPTSGTARVLGRDCTRLTAGDRARIGFVNEEHFLPPWLRVAELAAMQRRLYPGWHDERYRHIVGHFHVATTEQVGHLSRGERAGVSLALALAQRPELLILDEPTLGLDVVAKRVFLEALLNVLDDDGTTVIYCSHQMDEIERLADNLLILERGKLMHMSPPDEFCERVQLWVAEFGSEPADLARVPGVLQIQRIDGLVHCLVLDGDERFGRTLDTLGARRRARAEVNLDRAVNAVLTRNHAAPTAA